LNVKHKEKLTILSVSQLEWNTDLYSLARRPKAPDKGIWHINNKLRTEAHYIPQPKGRDCISNVTWWETSKLTKTYQQSQCDIHHETINVTRGHVVNTRRSMDVGTSTNMNHRAGRATQKPACNDDDDWSLSGPECRARNETEQLSEDSDELSEAPSNVRDPDKDFTGSLP
jgi:hypothetical protein